MSMREWLSVAMSMREWLSVALELAQADHDGAFKGRAAVYNREFETMHGSLVIVPGAFAESLEADRDRHVILWQHDDREPIGRPIDVRDGPDGIDIIGKLSDTGRGRDALTLLRDGVVKDLSIGLDRISEVKGGPGKPTRLTKGRIWEFSLVTFGAAGAIGAKVTDVHKAPTVKIVEPPLEVMRARVAAHDAKFGKPVCPSFAEQRLVRQLLTFLGSHCRLRNVAVQWFNNLAGVDGWAEVGIPTIRSDEATIHLRTGLPLERLARVLLHEAGHVHHRHRTASERAEQEAYAFECYWLRDLEYSRVVASALGY